MVTINDKQYEYKEGMTVSEAFRLACGKTKKEYIASVNGTFILYSEWDKTHIPDGSEVMLISVSTGG